MASPGEVPQEIGRAYVVVLTAALQAAMPFRAQFTAYGHPEKLNFGAGSGSYSFDVRGIYRSELRSRDVYVECKGRSVGADLPSQFKDFLSKAYALSTVAEHSVDRFWFVTNVPFNCTLGNRMSNRLWIVGALRECFSESRAVLKGLTFDANLADSLAKRVMAFILTDAFIRSTGLVYYVEEDENLWSITQQFYGGYWPEELVESYAPYANRVAEISGIDNPSRLNPGMRLQIPWYGMSW